MPIALIESLDHEGRGVAHVEGKTVFVDGALPLERVEFAAYRRKPSYELAQTVAILRPSSWRTEPRCRYFGICGGCSVQHLDARAQAAAKQRVLEDALWHIGRTRPEVIDAPILGPEWGYRHRARLSVRLVPKKGGVLVGFHERRSSYVADMLSCLVLPQAVSDLLLPLRELVAGLSLPDRLPQIEVAVAEDAVALCLRILQPLRPADEARIRDFADRHRVRIYLQPGGPDTAAPFHPAEARPLAYHLPEFDLELRFRPTDFTQVNHALNRVLVRRAVDLLDPRPRERIADMFCGLGNFALPIARRGAQLVGIEGNPGLVRRAAENAALNGLTANARFEALDLFAIDAASLAGLGRFDKMLIDPPREGAIELVKALREDAPRRVVYVSCNPATLARDAAVLSREKGYVLRRAGIANMFPQTSHVESVALFERQ
jgi:23S rRNA (uracil1939-C5)-methyltransferase